jgi:hypothetical protein
VTHLAQRRKHAGIEQPEIVEIVAIHALDPHPIAPVIARIPQAHCHRKLSSLKQKSPERFNTSPGFLSPGMKPGDRK